MNDKDQMQIDFAAPRVGYKERGGASQDAADALAASGRADALRARVLDYYRSGHAATADEVAAALGENILSIRPRVSELRTAGILVTTGLRRKSAVGHNATVWRAAA